MGWYGDNVNRKEKIAQLIKGGPKSECIAHCYRGGIFRGVLWSVWRNPNGTYILCDILEYRNNCWWNKPITEDMGPFYYSCPLSYLNMVPVKNQEWRNQVRNYHICKKLKAKRA